MFGFINIYKPPQISSHKVISILRKITGIHRIGHAGTLDPMAQGVLPVAIGKASKLIDYLPENKSYTVEMKLGFISDSFDITGKIEKTDAKKARLEEIEKIVTETKGEINQIPPAFSAVHYKGKRLYELAREGKIPNDIPIRTINIYKNQIISFDYENQILKLEIDCSKGTYIRTIVNDIGKILKTGAIMTKLERTKSSGMDIKDSVRGLETLTKSDIEKNIINPEILIPLKTLTVNEEEYNKIKNGNFIKNKTGEQGNILLKYNNILLAIANSGKETISPGKLLI